MKGGNQTCDHVHQTFERRQQATEEEVAVVEWSGEPESDGSQEF
jgi:hypothetical protein